MKPADQTSDIKSALDALVDKAVEERTEGLRNMCHAADLKIHRLEADHAYICKRHKSEVARSERLRDENKKLRVENETLHRIADELTPLPDRAEIRGPAVIEEKGALPSSPVVDAGRAEPGKTQQLAAALDRAHEDTAHSTMRFGPASPPSHPEPPRDDEGRPYPFSEPGDEPTCEDCAHEYDEEMVGPCETCRGYSGFEPKPERRVGEGKTDGSIIHDIIKRIGAQGGSELAWKANAQDRLRRIKDLEQKVKHLEQVTLSVEERETKARLDKAGEGGRVMDLNEIKRWRDNEYGYLGKPDTRMKVRTPIKYIEYLITQLEAARKEIHGLKATKESAYNAMNARLEEAERELARVREICDEYDDETARKRYVMMGPYALGQFLNRVRAVLDPTPPESEG